MKNTKQGGGGDKWQKPIIVVENALSYPSLGELGRSLIFCSKLYVDKILVILVCFWPL